MQRASPLPLATGALIAAQVVAWVVVRRFLLWGDDWTQFALRPGAPSEMGLIVSPFIHLDPTHLAVNLAVLWLFGAHLERSLGSLRFLLLYLGAACFASLMQWAAYTSFQMHADLGAQNAAIGASGAIAGVLGASFVRFPDARLRVPFGSGRTFSAGPVLMVWLVYTVTRALVTTLGGVNEGVGHWAHLAGFIFGLGVAQLGGLHHVARREHLERAAAAALRREDLPAAARAWSALLALRPDDLEVRSSLLSARLALGDVPGARRLAREGIEALVRAGDRRAAVETFAGYNAAVPDLDLAAGIRYRLGCWLVEAGEYETAFRALWDSVPEDGATSAAAAALYRAGQVAWERLRNPARARQAWERLLEQFPDSPWSDAAREGLRRCSGAV